MSGRRARSGGWDLRRCYGVLGDTTLVSCFGLRVTGDEAPLVSGSSRAVQCWWKGLEIQGKGGMVGNGGKGPRGWDSKHLTPSPVCFPI